MDQVALGISILAILIATASAVFTKQTADAARRSARADERSAITAETTNRREERQREEVAAQRLAEEAANQVRWEVRHLDGQTCRLDNMGTHLARSVTVTLPAGFEDPGFASDLPKRIAIKPRESARFRVFVLSQVDHVFVAWEGHPEPVRINILGLRIL